MTEITNEFFSLTGSKNDEDFAPENLMPAVLKKNCLFIVSAVLLEHDKVLLISEAKKECYGKWYLPAGKVEHKETLEDAFKRELVEESFLEGKPDHLLSIDRRPYLGYYRFNFIGHATGGRLKTLKDADGESLQADWFPISEVLTQKVELRYHDIIEIIQFAVNWREENGVQLKVLSLPLKIPHKIMCQRIILIDSCDRVTKVAVDKNTRSYPFILLGYPFSKTCMEYLKKNEVNAKVCGVLSIEHAPNKAAESIDDVSDGLCFNVLCILDEKNDGGNSNCFDWIDVPMVIGNKILSVICSKSYILLPFDVR